MNKIVKNDLRFGRLILHETHMTILRLMFATLNEPHRRTREPLTISALTRAPAMRTNRCIMEENFLLSKKPMWNFVIHRKKSLFQETTVCVFLQVQESNLLLFIRELVQRAFHLCRASTVMDP
jgi:hypothetical protein